MAAAFCEAAAARRTRRRSSRIIPSPAACPGRSRRSRRSGRSGASGLSCPSGTSDQSGASDPSWSSGPRDRDVARTAVSSRSTVAGAGSTSRPANRSATRPRASAWSSRAGADGVRGPSSSVTSRATSSTFPCRRINSRDSSASASISTAARTAAPATARRRSSPLVTEPRRASTAAASSDMPITRPPSASSSTSSAWTLRTTGSPCHSRRCFDSTCATRPELTPSFSATSCWRGHGGSPDRTPSRSGSPSSRRVASTSVALRPFLARAGRSRATTPSTPTRASTADVPSPGTSIPSWWADVPISSAGCAGAGFPPSRVFHSRIRRCSSRRVFAPRPGWPMICFELSSSRSATVVALSSWAAEMARGVRPADSRSVDRVALAAAVSRAFPAA